MARTKAPPAPTPEIFTDLVASAYKIDLTSAREAARMQAHRTRPWQQQAWDAYESIGEVWEAHNYVANAMARVRLFPAIQDNPSEIPVALDPEPDDGSAADPRAQAAVEELARIQSRIGGQAQILSDYALNIGVAGECYLVGHQVTDDGGPVDDWGIYSTDQIKVDGPRWKIVAGPQDTEGEVLDPETTVLVRLWQRHPRYKNDPDCAMRAVLGVCEELLILRQKIRGQALSALNNGLLLIDDSIVPGGQDKEKFLGDIISAIVAPVSDPSSPFAIAPNILTATGGDAGLASKVVRLTFERVGDAEDMNRLEALLGYLANGLDLPREVILGLSSSPFSRTAWQVDEQTAKAHIEPKAIILATSLTSAVLRTALRERGVQGWEDVVVWYDLGDIVGAPNESEEAKWAHDNFLISDSRARRAVGFSDADQPDDAEMQARVDRAIAERSTMRWTMTEGAPNGNAPTPPTEALSIRNRELLRAGGFCEPIALTASARDQSIAALGPRLSDMDRMLRAQLQAAADAAMTRALDRAGARLRSRMQGQPKMRARMANTADMYLAAHLGAEALAAAGVTEDELLADSFEELHPRWDAWTVRTQKRSTDAVRALDIPIDEPALAERQHEDRDAGWVLMSTALLALARERLYDPDPVAPPAGEFESGTRVPAGIVRGALARAGGARGQITRGGAALDPAGQPLGELATGPVVLDLLAGGGVTVATRTWVHGDPDRPLESHERLDGEEFSGWDDPVLANDDAFPDVEYLFPGDHSFCTCLAELSLESSGTEEP